MVKQEEKTLVTFEDEGNKFLQQLLDVYAIEARSILEVAVPVWLGGLAQKQSKVIE